jgi:hypothetical protein
VDHTAPFKLAKDLGQADRLDQVLYNLVETCRILSVMLWPFLPETAVKMAAQLALPTIPDKLSAASWGGLPPGITSGNPSRSSRGRTKLMRVRHLMVHRQAELAAEARALTNLWEPLTPWRGHRGAGQHGPRHDFAREDYLR